MSLLYHTELIYHIFPHLTSLSGGFFRFLDLVDPENHD